MRRLSIAAVVAVSVLSILACATTETPNWRLTPTYGSASLSAGFRPDPHVTEVLAGGDMDLATMGWTGFVADAPDLDLYYDGDDPMLCVYVTNAGADTVLLVNAPDGEWHFNDNADGRDPGVVFHEPPAGVYDIWVGTVQPEYADVELVISKSFW